LSVVILTVGISKIGKHRFLTGIKEKIYLRLQYSWLADKKWKLKSSGNFSHYHLYKIYPQLDTYMFCLLMDGRFFFSYNNYQSKSSKTITILLHDFSIYPGVGYLYPLLCLRKCYPTQPNYFFMTTTTTTKVQLNKLPQTTILFRIVDGTIRFNNAKIQTQALGSICVCRDGI